MDELQVENGQFTRIINKAIDELVKAGLLGAELAVVLFIIRKTWGFNKPEDIISLTQFEKATLISRPTIVKTLKNLIHNKIVVKRALPDTTIAYKFNKYYTQWGSKAGLTSKATLTRPSKHRLTGASKAGLTHKRHSLKTITKDISEQSSQAQDLFKFFYENINPNINFANKTDRQAADWLIGKYGFEKTLSAAKYAASVQKDKYAPTITTPYQLKEKMAALIKFKGAKKGKIWTSSSATQPWQQGQK